MMRLLATDHSRIAFEGNLRGTELFEMDGGSHEEGGQLKRASTAPPLDFVVLPLTKAASAEIEKAIYSKIGFTRYDGIVHVQIESEREIAFAAYDNFDRGSVVVNAMVPPSALDDLVRSHVLRGYSPTTRTGL
jgi:hypothetical protein